MNDLIKWNTNTNTNTASYLLNRPLGRMKQCDRPNQTNKWWFHELMLLWYFVNMCTYFAEVKTNWKNIAWLNNGSSLTRARPGGGYPSGRPPSGFSQIAKKTVARSVAKFAIAVQPAIWHISKKNDDPMTPKVTPPGHIKWPDLKLRFSKFDIVPKAHQWSELIETRSVQ